jgi:predicted Zn-dependent protease
LLEGVTLLGLGRPQQATESLVAAVECGPPNVEAYYHLAQAQLATGEYAEAAATAHLALSVDGSHEPSRQLAARLASQTEASGLPRR